MSFPTQNFISVPYSGVPFSVPVALCTTQTAQSKIVKTTFDWINKYPNQAVTVNLQSVGTATPLDKIVMVYVDNTENSLDVSILFADSQQIVTINAGAAGYFPVFTSSLACFVYNGYSATAPLAVNANTSIMFCNFCLPGFLNSIEQLPIISQEAPTSVSFAAPATGTATTTVLPAVTYPRQYVITGYTISLLGFYTQGINSELVIALQGTTLVTGVGLVNTYLEYVSLLIGPDLTYYTGSVLISKTGLQIPTQSLVLEAIPLTGGYPEGAIFITTQYSIIS